MGTVTKTSLGTITIHERHRTTNGVIYRKGDITDYFSIIEREEGCGCPSQTFTTNKYYQILGGLIPTKKASINEQPKNI